MITQYEIKRNPKPVFFVTSKEKHNCPDCGGKLLGHGTDKRHIKKRTRRKRVVSDQSEEVHGMQKNTQHAAGLYASPQALPTRSVSDIIKILELEGRVKPGVLKRSTLQRHLQECGYSRRQMMMYQKTGKAARRFQKEHRCELWQSDVKYGPYLPIGEGGAKKQVYLCTFIDDATRYIVSAGFFSNQNVDMVESCLRQAVMRFGKPEILHLDNGKIYRSDWLKKACARLGIRIVHTKPYSPEAHGKVEAFNRRIDSFLSEAALQKCETLDDLNHYLELWIDGYYHKNCHSSLGNISPASAFSMDTRPLQFVSDQALREAFLHTEERLVDKTGCISFNGKQYEVGMKLMGRKVEVLYDPACIDQLEIHHKDFEPFFVKQLEMIRIMQNKRIITIIDESHLMERETLEELRFLLNYRMDSQNPMALVLVGQNELWDKLRKQTYSAIRQRIDIKCEIPQLDRSQIEAYITSHLVYAEGKLSITCENVTPYWT